MEISVQGVCKVGSMQVACEERAMRICVQAVCDGDNMGGACKMGSVQAACKAVSVQAVQWR